MELHGIIHQMELSTASQYLERYPGNNYIDLLGFDCYQSNMEQKSSLRTALNQKLKMVSEIAAANHKIAALTEVGFESVPDPVWWSDFLWKAISNTGISYALTWRNAWNSGKHYYAPFPGQASADDFLNFYNLEETLFQKEVTNEGLYQ